MGVGEPGQPGKPGELGTRGGGAGGAGGEGGRGGRGGRDFRLLALVTFVVLATVGLSVATLIFANDVHQNTQQIERARMRDAVQEQALGRALTLANDRQDFAIVGERKALYGVCVRQQRAFAVVTVVLTRLHPDQRIPHLQLFDCKPNLTGEPARPLTPAQSRAVLARTARSER